MGLTRNPAAIAAAGGFEPDPPGALGADRGPPGFDAVGVVAKPIKEPQTSSDRAGHATARERHRAELRAAEEKERKRKEAECARRKAERSRIQAALREATLQVRARERAPASLQEQLRETDEALSRAQQTLEDLERQLAELEGGD